jgi:hypothetical protein
VFGELVPPPAPEGTQLSRDPIAAVRRGLEISFDQRFGGFGGAPKFPHPASIERLLREWRLTASAPEPDLKALYMATLTLRRMADGGIYDQLGGGFCRYSVDSFWMIPHFEKMLYDNGPLLALLAQAAVATGDPFFRAKAIETAAWALREMRAPEGGFYSTIDADSEGHEGRFYVWQRGEVEALLAPDAYRVFARRFGLDRAPNFEGAWHLHGFVDIEQIAAETGIEPARVAAMIDAARASLFAERESRVRPGCDDKVLTAWNGLMIRGLAISGRLLGDSSHVDAAAAAADFLRRHCWKDGELRAAWKHGQARFPAYLDDYAFLIGGLLELMQARFRAEDLAFARELAEVLLARFSDAAHGGFWFTAEGRDPPLHRPKSFADEATPSGNGIAAQALARLGWLLGDTRYLDAAEGTLRGGFPSLDRVPQAHTAMLNALDEYLDPGEIVVIRGTADAVAAWSAALASIYAPRRMVIAIPSDAGGLPEALAAKHAHDGTIAYICRGPQCREPVTELPSLLEMLRAEG